MTERKEDMMVGWLRERGRDDGWMVEREEDMMVGWLRERKRRWMDG
jgi:hypothetical protein